MTLMFIDDLEKEELKKIQNSIKEKCDREL
jgi:hypothetical protein